MVPLEIRIYSIINKFTTSDWIWLLLLPLSIIFIFWAEKVQDFYVNISGNKDFPDNTCIFRICGFGTIIVFIILFFVL